MTITADSEASTDVAVTGLFQSHGPEYPVGWYPVGLSAELAVGEVRRIELCDGRLVLYRGDDGIARVMTPYCKHMGSDLGVGDVVGTELRCAFHHWHYGPDGRCTKIPSGDRIPGSAVLHAFRVEEKLGIIWTYWGDEPQYELPEFDDWDDDTWVYRAFEVQLGERLMIEPWVFTTNAFDFQHFRVVHKIPDLNPEVNWNEWGAEWTATIGHPTVGEMVMSLTTYGTNAVKSRSLRGDDILTHIAGVSPMGSEGLRFFVAVATRRVENAEELLDQRQAMNVQLVLEDLPIMTTLRLGDGHFVASDRELVKFIRYVRDFPRAAIAQFEDVGRLRTAP